MFLKLIYVIAYLNMNAIINIGALEIKNVHSFTIEQSVKEMSDRAVITIARNYKEMPRPILDYIHAGNTVKISFGYNGESVTEFEGYVKPGIDADFPIRLECDQLYMLRKNNLILSYQDVSLKTLLQTIAPGYKIECPSTLLGRHAINNASTVDVLKDLESHWGLFFRVNGNILTAGWPFDFRPSYIKSVDYIIGENVRSYRNLKFKKENDFSTTVRVYIRNTNGRKTKVEKGNGDKIIDTGRTFKDSKAANDYADAVLLKTNYDGYFGSVTGFCTPRCNAGDSINIIDKVRPERNGTYVVERVRITYEESHITRDCYISFKTSS